jgi:hypothetical protein
VFEASPLEWVVVQSFAEIEPSFSGHRGTFTNWSNAELYLACYSTDDVKEVNKEIFNNETMLRKMKSYVTLFHGAACALDEGVGTAESQRIASALPEDRRLLDLVREWSDGIDPLTYVVMMKKRIDTLSGKVVRLNNTVEIWKGEATSKGKEVGDLKRRLHFLKKK